MEFVAPFSEAALKARQAKLAALLSEAIKPGECVLVASGDPIGKPGGLDQTYRFLPHPQYLWLTGRRRPGECIVFSREEGWIHFTRPLSRQEAIWEGGWSDPNPGRDIAELDSYLARRKFIQVYACGAPPDQNPFTRSDEIHQLIDQCRRQKDAEEVALIRRAAQIAKQGYLALHKSLRAGISEIDLQAAYEGAILQAGSHGLPYETIIGSGPRAATLHALPSRRTLDKDDLVLVDAGADLFDYCVDITRVFSVSDSFASRQSALYEIVLKAQKIGISHCQAGTPWHEVHLATARVIAEGLKHLGILKGSVDTLVEKQAISVFYPHGVGHLVGLRVRDTGHEENSRPKTYAGVTLRMDLPLSEGLVVTVEPGCYFIDALIRDAETRARFKTDINWSEAEKWLDVGGVRIEDDILITPQGPENLTEVVEKVRV